MRRRSEAIRPLGKVLRAYLIIEEYAPFQWREDIPELAKEHRRSRNAAAPAAIV
jgi:hypothetical protein